MFVFIRQQSEQFTSLTNLRPLNATINLGNIGPDLGGVGGWGLRSGPGSLGREPASIFIEIPTSMM